MQSERKTLLSSSFFKVNHQKNFPLDQTSTVMEVCDEANYLLIGTQDLLIILDKNDLSEMQRISVEDNTVYSAKFYNQGKNILCLHDDDTLRSWDITSSKSDLIRQYGNKIESVHILDCEKDKAILHTKTWHYSQIEILNITEKSFAQSWILPHKFQDISLSVDKSLLICSYRSQNKIYIYNVKEQKLLTSISIDRDPGLFLKAKISFDNSLLMVANSTSITLYNVGDNTVYKEIKITDIYRDFMLTHENKYLIICGDLEKHKANIAVYDLSLKETDQPIAKETYDLGSWSSNLHLNEELLRMTVMSRNQLTIFPYQGSLGPKMKYYYPAALFEMSKEVKESLPFDVRSLIYTFLLRFNQVNDITTEEFSERVKLFSEKISEQEAPVSWCALF